MGAGQWGGGDYEPQIDVEAIRDPFCITLPRIPINFVSSQTTRELKRDVSPPALATPASSHRPHTGGVSADLRQCRRRRSRAPSAGLVHLAQHRCPRAQRPFPATTAARAMAFFTVDGQQLVVVGRHAFAVQQEVPEW